MRFRNIPWIGRLRTGFDFGIVGKGQLTGLDIDSLHRIAFQCDLHELDLNFWVKVQTFVSDRLAIGACGGRLEKNVRRQQHIVHKSTMNFDDRDEITETVIDPGMVLSRPQNPQWVPSNCPPTALACGQVDLPDR